MKDKSHFISSIIKSCLRIVSCIYLMYTWDFIWFACGLVMAELIGIGEELLDERE